MKRLSRLRLLWPGLPLVAAAALVGCADANRVGALNLETPGAKVAATLEHTLAVRGFPGAHVTCTKTVVVNVGGTASCRLSGARRGRRVTFTFTNYRAKIETTSVKVS